MADWKWKAGIWFSNNVWYKFGPNRKLVWTAEGRQKLGAGREAKESWGLKPSWVGIPVSCLTRASLFPVLPSTPPPLREFLVILPGKQLQAKETAKPHQPLNCAQKWSSFLTGGMVWHTGLKRCEIGFLTKTYLCHSMFCTGNSNPWPPLAALQECCVNGGR